MLSSKLIAGGGASDSAAASDLAAPDSAATQGTRPPKSDARQRHASARGLVGALCAVLTLSACAWLAASAMAPKGKHTLLVLGDSFFASYRLDPGNRFQDWLARDLGEGWKVASFAAPAAQPGDFYLQLCEAEFLGVRPEVVLIGLGPQQLVPEFEDSVRLDEDGTNLMWLPLNREGQAYFRSLDSHLREVAVVRKLGLLFGFYDALRALWLEHVEWPSDRLRRARADHEQRASWIAARATEFEKRWRNRDDAANAVASGGSELARDFVFLVDALHRRGVRVLAVIPPALHTGVRKALSAQTRRNLDAVYQQTLALCESLRVPVVDFNAPQQRDQFAARQWDDVLHLRDPSAFGRMSGAVVKDLDL